jgi:hypothetical protein
MQDSLPSNPVDAPCASFRANLDDLVSDEADALTHARAAAHVAACTPCRLALTAARAYRRALRRLGAAARAPETLRHRALGILREVRGSRTS